MQIETEKYSEDVFRLDMEVWIYYSVHVCSMGRLRDLRSRLWSASLHVVPPVYQPRDPSGTILYQVIADHLETFLATLAADPTAKGLSDYVVEELYAYLQCGILVHGFSLHANTHIPAHRRDQLERLLRYTARGAVSLLSQGAGDCSKRPSRGVSRCVSRGWFARKVLRNSAQRVACSGCTLAEIAAATPAQMRGQVGSRQRRRTSREVLDKRESVRVQRVNALPLQDADRERCRECPGGHRGEPPTGSPWQRSSSRRPGGRGSSLLQALQDRPQPLQSNHHTNPAPTPTHCHAYHRVPRHWAAVARPAAFSYPASPYSRHIRPTGRDHRQSYRL